MFRTRPFLLHRGIVHSQSEDRAAVGGFAQMDDQQVSEVVPASREAALTRSRLQRASVGLALCVPAAVERCIGLFRGDVEQSQDRTPGLGNRTPEELFTLGQSQHTWH